MKRKDRSCEKFRAFVAVQTLVTKQGHVMMLACGLAWAYHPFFALLSSLLLDTLA
jgi:hypothetical protein